MFLQAINYFLLRNYLRRFEYFPVAEPGVYKMQSLSNAYAGMVLEPLRK